MEVEISVVNTVEELKELIELFEDEAKVVKVYLSLQKDYLLRLFNNPDFIAIVAKKRGYIIAGVTISLLQYFLTDKPTAYLFNVEIDSEYVNHGVYEQLIAFAKNHCHKLGCEELFFHYPRIDGYGIEFLEGAKPFTEKKMMRYSFEL